MGGNEARANVKDGFGVGASAPASWQLGQTRHCWCSLLDRWIEMFTSKRAEYLGIAALLFLSTVSARAQRVRGELRLEVRDPQGTAVSTAGELVSEANGFRRTFVAGPEGRYVAQDLPFGVYRLSLHAAGFAPWSDLVEIRSEVPVRVLVTLGVAPVTTPGQGNDSASVVDPYAPGTLEP